MSCLPLVRRRPTRFDTEGSLITTVTTAEASADDERCVVCGTDTHTDTIHVAALDLLGRELGDREFVTTPAGYAAALAFLTSFGVVWVVGIEGGSYGAGFARAAAAVKDESVEALRALNNARRSAVKARTVAMNQIQQMLITAPSLVREKYRALTDTRPIKIELCHVTGRLAADHSYRRSVSRAREPLALKVNIETRVSGGVLVADGSSIEWTEATWNPTTGCDRVSTGCDHCYALTLAKRLKAMGAEKYQNDGDARSSGPGFGVTVHPSALRIPYRWRTSRLVFVNSMSDLFHAKVPIEFVQQVFEVMADTPRHTYQVLTKRPHRLARLAAKLTFPSNVWIGTSVENAEVLSRADALREVPAALRFLSCEPLLGSLRGIDLGGIGWVIAGGESGPSHRPVRPEWVSELRDACEARTVPFFFKQWGGRTPKAGGRLLDERVHDDMPARLLATA
jgi:protein gp37